MDNLKTIEALEEAVGYLKRDNPIRYRKFIKESRERIFCFYHNIGINYEGGPYLVENPDNSGMDVGHFIQNMLDRGDLKDYPKNPICSHFGMFGILGMDFVQMSSRGDNVQFVISLSSGYGTKRLSKSVRKNRSYPKRIFDLRT